MDVPVLAGVHHLKLPVRELARSVQWYESRLGYRLHLEFVEDGRLMGVVLRHPDGGPDLGLRLDPDRAEAAAGFDYFAIGVPGEAEIRALAEHLSLLGETHAGVHWATVGWILPELHDPDGHEIRFYTLAHHTVLDSGSVVHDPRESAEQHEANTPASAPGGAARGLPRHPISLVMAGLLLLLLTACGQSVDSTNVASSGSPDPSSPQASAPLSDGLNLVVLGDSIPYNSPEDCPGCTGFVDLYATAVAEATGRPVEVNNQSEHTGLTLPDLLAKLDSLSAVLSEADVIVVGIAHNSIELNDAEPCGAVFDEDTNTLSDWSKVDATCASKSATAYRKDYEDLFATIASIRDGQPTILRALNKYSDWIGWEDGHLTPAQEKKTVLMHDAWNTMLCNAAESNGFGCVDVYHAFNGPSGSQPAGVLLADDYTHPSQAGNDRIAQELEQAGYAPLSSDQG